MKIKKLLILGILSIIGLSSYSFADFTDNGFDYPSGVYWSSSLGLITAIGNQEIITIKDKNLGATTVYEYGDTLSENNAGKLFQWGNNYGFPFAGNISVGNLSADLTQYGPGNYFYSDVFVKNSNFSATNGNLWGDTTNTLDARQGPCETGYHVPSASELTTLYNIYIFNGGGSSNGDLFVHFYKIPIAGFRVSYSAETAVGGEGMYWSSTPAPRASIQLHFTSTSINPNYNLIGAYGGTIRPFKNSYVLPDSSWVALVGSTEGLPAPSNPDGGNGGTGGIIDLGITPYSSMYYNCIGPYYNTPDGKPPVYCLNLSGDLIDLDQYKDCWYENYIVSGELTSTMYCSIDGSVQPMYWEASGSGGQYVPCSGDDCSSKFTIGPNYLNGSDLTGDYLTTGLVDSLITNITGWLFKCPFPYDDFELGKNFGLTKYLKTLGFSFDPLIFINCSWAGLQYGRSLVDESLGLGDLWEYGPLIKRSGSSFIYTNALCSFFDFILILTLIGLVKFIKKLF